MAGFKPTVSKGRGPTNRLSVSATPDGIIFHRGDAESSVITWDFFTGSEWEGTFSLQMFACGKGKAQLPIRNADDEVIGWWSINVKLYSTPEMLEEMGKSPTPTTAKTESKDTAPF